MRPTPLLIAFFAVQLFWILFSLDGFSSDEIIRRLANLDSSWYTHIASHGYSALPGTPHTNAAAFAFFPLWPLLLKILSMLSVTAIPLPVLGSWLSSALFVGWTYYICRQQTDTAAWLRPRSQLGLGLMVFSPGAWVFASNHTESLFLVLSYAALLMAHRRAAGYAAMAAGLACLTRNQGALVAFCAMIELARQIRLQKSSWRPLLIYLLISTSIASLWPFWQWSQTGNPLASLTAQQEWFITASLQHYVSNLLWLSPNNLGRACIMWLGIVGGGIAIYRSPGWLAPGLYIMLSCLLWPLQGNNLPQAYRFSAVLFPLWFAVGDFLNQKLSVRSLKVAAGIVIFVICFIRASYFYQQNHWPY